MADFKIIGNSDPIVGNEEFYTVNNFMENVFPSQNTSKSNNFEHPVKWEIYVLENGRWRKTKENDKTGKKVSYTFLQKSLERKGIRILAKRGEDVARLNITPHPADKPKIESIELLDKNGKKPSKPLSYGQTVKARVHCLHMNKRRVFVTLWEDDHAKGEKNKTNQKNIIKTLSGIVKNGIADIDFVLSPSQANIFKMKRQNEIHEYYVTSGFDAKGLKSNPVDVNELETPVEPYKGKTAPQQPEKNKPAAQQPVQHPKTSTQVATGASKAKAEITNVHLTDTAGKPIKGVFKDKQVKVWIDSKELIGKEIQLKLYDDDVTSKDLLFDQKFTIKSNIYAVVVSLNQIPRSKGGGFWTEGAEQELFAEVKVLNSNIEKESAVVKVDAEVFQQDTFEIVNSFLKFFVPKKDDKKKEQNCGGKYCIDKNSPPSELIREINIRLAGFGGNVPTDKFTDRTEKMIKQFQRDYMKVPETGKVCGNVLKAIDDFQNKFTIDFTEAMCKCGKCAGFGDASNKGQYLSKNIEAFHKYEYPGIHRSLLSSLRSVKFYLAKDGRYSFNKINSGYRCRFHPEYLKKPTTNHMGKALDLHFNDKNGRTKKTSDMETIRKDIFNKYLGAQWDWKKRNIFNLESTAVGALTWVHYDVREFDSIYLSDNFFIKNLADLNGKSIVALSHELGFIKTCNCTAVDLTSNKKDNFKNNKYKWSHSEFGNLIAKKESSDNYNICNKTKGGYQIINNVKVVELTIEEIQKKQKDRDLFAVGRYQLVPNTLNDAVEKLALDTNQKLDEEMQDKIFDEYLIKIKRPKIIAYLENNGSIEEAMYASAMEWASIGVEKGKRISDKIVKKEGEITKTIRYAEGGESYYAEDGLNKAHITPEEIQNVLTNSKNENN